MTLDRDLIARTSLSHEGPRGELGARRNTMCKNKKTNIKKQLTKKTQKQWKARSFARVLEHKAGAGSRSTGMTPAGANNGTGGAAAAGTTGGGGCCAETGGCQWPCHQFLVMSSVELSRT